MSVLAQCCLPCQLLPNLLSGLSPDGGEAVCGRSLRSVANRNSNSALAPTPGLTGVLRGSLGWSR